MPIQLPLLSSEETFIRLFLGIFIHMCKEKRQYCFMCIDTWLSTVHIIMCLPLSSSAVFLGKLSMSVHCNFASLFITDTQYSLVWFDKIYLPIPLLKNIQFCLQFFTVKLNCVNILDICNYFSTVETSPLLVLRIRNFYQQIML